MIIAKNKIKTKERVNMNALCITAIASNEGKTVLTTALLYHFKQSVRAYKIGPDYIDPLFHESICNKPSINLDTFLMNEEQVKWIYKKYANKDMNILEGVMGFYDGKDKGCSAYDVSKLLNIPSVLLLSGAGSYITISAILKGLKTYTKHNTIKAVVLNKLSSSMHYDLIKKQILKDFDDVVVLGWIKKDLKTLKNTHLGLDLVEANKEILEDLSKEVLEHIDLEALKKVSFYETNCEANYNDKIKQTNIYPFSVLKKTNKKVSIVKDKNFSFIYHDNIEFLKEIFQKVEFIDSCKNEQISEDSDLVYICGGYVETKEAYARLQNAPNFKASLTLHAKTKHIYAECAGLLYLGNKVDNKSMTSILNVDFALQDKRSRLGYYYSSNGLKGHAFHYTYALDIKKDKEDKEVTEDKKDKFTCDILSKQASTNGEIGAWKSNKVYGTYLHIMFRNHIHILKDYFGV